MTNSLKVVKPFFVMEPGDTFEKDDRGMYVSKYESKYSMSGDDTDVNSTYTSTYEIDENYAKALINDGILEEVGSEKKDDFVNIFDEIEKLYSEYAKDLANLDDEMKDAPSCLKVEKETVLRNMSKLLDHLYSLKK